MARIILKNEQVKLEKREKLLTGFSSDRNLLNKRSKEYLKLVTSLDHGTLTETKGMNELLEAIRQEFGQAELASLPVGIVSKCFLGHPYEVHTLDLSATQIVRHYKSNEKMEGDFEKARALAMHNAYALVEVYTDKLILVREDGTAIKV